MAAQEFRLVISRYSPLVSFSLLCISIGFYRNFEAIRARYVNVDFDFDFAICLFFSAGSSHCCYWIMAFQGHKSWTPLESSDGDLGTTYPPVDLPQDDTSYHGYDGSNAKGDSSSQLSPYLDGYEMNDMGE